MENFFQVVIKLNKNCVELSVEVVVSVVDILVGNLVGSPNPDTNQSLTLTPKLNINPNLQDMT